MNLPTPQSLWLATAPPTSFPPLDGSAHADVVVAGGGILGLTTALELQLNGRQVTLIEARRIGHGVTGHSTAKVTVGHNAIYGRLVDEHGEERAGLYAAANTWGVSRVAELVRELAIDCALEQATNYIYAASAEDRELLEREAQVATELGLLATFHATTDLRLGDFGALAYDHQLQFHPQRYLLGLADAFIAAGGVVHEGTRVLDVDDGAPATVTTEHGVISANDVVLATHIPTLDRGLFWVKTHPKREYVVVAPVHDGVVPAGMFISTEDVPHSFRTFLDGDQLLLIVCGEAHKTGQADPDTCYRALVDWAVTTFGVTEIAYRWSTQDNVSTDRMPFAGAAYPGAKHVVTASGFGGWGLSNGTACAHLLADSLLGRENPWADAFDAQRTTIRTGGTRELLRENINAVAGHLIGDRLRGGTDVGLADLAPGAGAVVRMDGHWVAAHRDDAGELHTVSAVCTHVGCIVQWNGAEKSFDCPCHGSRFAADGAVLHGPAVRALAPIAVEVSAER